MSALKQSETAAIPFSREKGEGGVMKAHRLGPPRAVCSVGAGVEEV